MRIVDVEVEAATLCLTTYGDALGDNLPQSRDAVRARLNCPVVLGAFKGIQVDNRTSPARYTATFTGTRTAPGARPVAEDLVTLTLRVTDSVMEFLASYARRQGSWVGMLNAGTLTDVNLLT